jgi:uncharacterized protein (TIGR00730 family)
MQVCVYCASSAKIDSAYFEATAELAQLLVANDVQVVFGGGGSGLMGKLADVVIQLGGKIKGIMPQFMNEVEWGHTGVSDFTYTQTMHERKSKFLDGTDAIIALPGGTGTFEELFEAITLKKLGQIDTPIVILNTRGYYNLFKQWMELAEEENFMSKDQSEIWRVVDTPAEVLPAIQMFERKRIDIRNAGKMR